MKSKRIFFILVCFMVITGVVWSGGQADGDTASEDSGQKVIGFAMVGVGMNAYLTTWVDMFTSEAEALGYKVIMTDANFDAATQANQIENLMEQDVDAMVVWPVDVYALIPSFRKVFEAGIPVISSNTSPAPEGYRFINAYTGPDDYIQGGIVATQAVKDLKARGLMDTGKVVEIIGVPGYSAFVNRQRGFDEKLGELAPNVKILAVQPSNGAKEEAMKVMENFITAYGDEIDGVYCHDDFIAEGAFLAIESAGYKPNEDIMIWGLGGSMVGLAHVKAGEFTSTTSQQPSVDAKMSVKVIAQLLRGEEPEFFNYIDTPIVTAENVDGFLPGEW